MIYIRQLMRGVFFLFRPDEPVQSHQTFHKVLIKINADQILDMFHWISGSQLYCALTGAYLFDIFCSGIQFYLLLSPVLCFNSFLYLHLYVLGDDALMLGVFHANQTSLCLDLHLN